MSTASPAPSTSLRRASRSRQRFAAATSPTPISSMARRAPASARPRARSRPRSSARALRIGEDAERRVLSGVHPDLSWVEPRGAHDVLVDDVRTQVVRQAALRPFEAQRRVFVIVEADRMNDEAQNALAEDARGAGVVRALRLVSSAPGRLLPTIVSRLPAGPLRPGAARRGSPSCWRRKAWSDGRRSPAPGSPAAT